MGKKGRLKEIRQAVKEELKFQKKVIGGVAEEGLEWTQDLTAIEVLQSVNHEKSLNQMLILLLFSFHIPIFKPWLSIIMGIFSAFQLWQLLKFLISLRRSKKAKGL